MLNYKGSWSTCILQGLTTFLQCAFTAHRQPAIEGAIPDPLVGRRKARYLLQQGTSPHAPR